MGCADAESAYVIDRFSSKEDPPKWDEPAFREGFKARSDGLGLSHCPSVATIGPWAWKSWRAGWNDAHAGIAADGLADQMPIRSP